MTRHSHRRLLGALLMMFAVINIAVGFAMLGIIPFSEFERDPSGRAISYFIYLVVYATIALFAVQLLSAIVFLINTTSSRSWGLVASVIAVLGGASLPVGVYGIWLLASGSSDKSGS